MDTICIVAFRTDTDRAVRYKKVAIEPNAPMPTDVRNDEEWVKVANILRDAYRDGGPFSRHIRRPRERCVMAPVTPEERERAKAILDGVRFGRGDEPLRSMAEYFGRDLTRVVEGKIERALADERKRLEEELIQLVDDERERLEKERDEAIHAYHSAYGDGYDKGKADERERVLEEVRQGIEMAQGEKEHPYYDDAEHQAKRDGRQEGLQKALDVLCGVAKGGEASGEGKP